MENLKSKPCLLRYLKKRYNNDEEYKLNQIEKSKKQYEKMPEKKHPEKTVKYKKKKTNENLEKFLEEKFIYHKYKRIFSKTILDSYGAYFNEK